MVGAIDHARPSSWPDQPSLPDVQHLGPHESVVGSWSFRIAAQDCNDLLMSESLEGPFDLPPRLTNTKISPYVS